MAAETAPSSSVKIPPWLADLVIKAADSFWAKWPQKKPTQEQLFGVQLISHRGQRSEGIVENSYAAFDHLIDTGISGIEFDIRWTKDLYPVVFHDADFKRVLQCDGAVSNFTLEELQQQHPEIPPFKAFVKRYAPHFFLTVELKSEPYSNPSLQNQRLAEALDGLEAAQDFILMSFDIELLKLITFAGNHAKLGIMHSNPSEMSETAIKEGWIGVGGHFVMLSNKLINRHKQAGQSIAVGFPHSKNSLYREIHRGCRWIFCDDALQAQAWLK